MFAKSSGSAAKTSTERTQHEEVFSGVLFPTSPDTLELESLMHSQICPWCACALCAWCLQHQRIKGNVCWTDSWNFLIEVSLLTGTRKLCEFTSTAFPPYPATWWHVLQRFGGREFEVWWRWPWRKSENTPKIHDISSSPSYRFNHFFLTLVVFLVPVGSVEPGQ